MSDTFKIGDTVRNKRTGRIAKVCELPPFHGATFLRVSIVYATGYIERRAWTLKNLELVNPNNNQE